MLKFYNDNLNKFSEKNNRTDSKNDSVGVESPPKMLYPISKKKKTLLFPYLIRNKYL